MYFYTTFSVLSIIFLYNLIEGNETSCETSQKLFADLCFSPNPRVVNLDFTDLTHNAPMPGKIVYYTHIGNDVEQLHLSEVLKGELHSPKDDFSDLCCTFTIEHGENTTGDGKISGYGNLTSQWQCKSSLDFPGADRCDLKSSLSKYHEDALQYLTFVDMKTEFSIYISCYPNGQVGWGTYSLSPILTEKEDQFAREYAETLGFPKDTHAVLHRNDCL